MAPGLQVSVAVMGSESRRQAPEFADAKTLTHVLFAACVFAYGIQKND